MHAMIKLSSAALAAALLLASPALAQGVPGAADVSRVTPGTYTVEPNHTQVTWTVNHLGFTMLSGMFGSASGTMTLDPAHPDQASITVDFPIDKVATTREGFTTHLLHEQILDVAKFPTASFHSTGVEVSGQNAKISGTLTLHGVTKPVVLDAHFIGAGTNPLSKKLTIGFDATAAINRSDFGLTYSLPGVSDRVELHIAAAFEKAQ
jgi:polyisoprenoid-binding protein YceI